MWFGGKGGHTLAILWCGTHINGLILRDREQGHPPPYTHCYHANQHPYICEGGLRNFPLQIYLVHKKARVQFPVDVFLQQISSIQCDVLLISRRPITDRCSDSCMLLNVEPAVQSDSSLFFHLITFNLNTIKAKLVSAPWSAIMVRFPLQKFFDWSRVLLPTGARTCTYIRKFSSCLPSVLIYLHIWQ